MDSHREMRVDMSLLVSKELRYIKRESHMWMATLNIDMLLKSRGGKNRSKRRKRKNGKAARKHENLT